VNCKNYLIALLSLQSFFYAFANAQVLPNASPNMVGISAEKASQLKNEINSRVTKGELPGAVLMVVRNQKIAIHEAIGFRDVADKSPMQKDSIFRIASMTKPITTAAALQLMEQGRLSLEDPVAKFLPEFSNVKVGVDKLNDKGNKELVLEAPLKKMTIQDLMRHTSGLTFGWEENALVDQLYKENKLFNADLTLEEQIKKLAALPLKYQPGTTWEYGMSTEVLGRILEVVSGKLTPQTRTNDNGRVLKHWFCSECGTQILGMVRGTAPDIYQTVRVGTLDNSRGLPPPVHIWTRSAQDWFVFPTHAKCFKENPPVPLLQLMD